MSVAAVVLLVFAGLLLAGCAAVIAGLIMACRRLAQSVAFWMEHSKVWEELACNCQQREVELRRMHLRSLALSPEQQRKVWS